MAFENLFIRKRKGIIGPIKIDSLVDESVNYSMRVTTNPVETGEQVADHIIREPVRYTMNGVITNTPLWLKDSFGNFMGSGGGVVDAVTGLFGASELTGQTRSQQIFNELLRMMYSKEPVDIQAAHRLFRNMIFESIVSNTDKSTANSIVFTATFTEAIIVETARIDLEADKIIGDENQVAYSTKVNAGKIGVVDPAQQDLEIFNTAYGINNA